MYLADEKKEWSELEIKIIDEYSIQDSIDSTPIYMIIYLKCKWFEGEYEIIGTIG